MGSVTFVNRKGEMTLNSSKIEDTLKIMADFDYVKDITESISQGNIMVFDCKLDKSVFKYEEMDDEFYDDVEVDEEYFQVMFEDIKEYIKDVCDHIEDDLRDEYKYDKIQVHFEIYNLDETFTEVSFVVCISFKEMKRLELMDLTKLVAKRQLEGSSKYFN
ncbi:hypothetical protein SAMN05661008_01152 [Alkalithermobacter thermoalcaliphilus JW-YL-7 = DSM 7308]|uniref:Uncharacterized protein n=1 Tax=Alkalithermobacter thermoalcaliphilus JW-YL-7 = DSM 7308 TaxID=1121328 RepID=A0A150FNE9_CLOPD|nr:hypothetical protein JWYL7_0238 [[Clostridium] paradoxum JW-YL-7 = DSM 7308]SHK92620.1 hypothetical protein SAMN05661008_01152 [[Clostridium] paradoxum JW-YL-7 = DSM 7308]